MRTYAFIFARGGSKGLSGKNIRELAGKPLLVHSIDLAMEIEAVEKIFVSTEDQTIANIAQEYGAKVINRPAQLARDDTPEWLVWQHAVKWIENHEDKFDVFLSLPATSPLRNRKDILSALECLDTNTDLVLTMTEAARSPWFNMVKRKDDGFIELLVQSERRINHRQDVPLAFDLTTVAYVTRPEFIKSAGGIFEGRIKGVEIPVERALDIDTSLDLEIAKFLMDRAFTEDENKLHAG